MQALTHSIPDQRSMTAGVFGIRRAAVEAFIRRWWPYVLTAVVVPGGIAIVLLMLWRARA
jgi:hypothetical protein